MVSYYYLISSLPMLFFGARLPFSFAVFLDKCRDFVSQRDMDILKDVSLRNDGIKGEEFYLLRSWKEFDADLRNELVKIRAHRKHIGSSKYLRQERYVPVDTVSLAVAVSRNPSILDSEKSLDQTRWNFLEELSCGHYFDLEFLLVYGLQLRILEKWERINTADKRELLEHALK